ncbi:MAG: alanine racemase [Anaerolineales bacterium]|nr:alanine racemase [Anaerolineales bacterium]
MIYLDDILQATNGQLVGQVVETSFRDFCFDSRRVEKGQLFIAIRTGKGDGHDYILDAIRGGAFGVICQKPIFFRDRQVTCIVVPDTEVALVQWASFILKKFGTDVIAVTGSVGKTGVKEALASVLRTRFKVFSNQGSYNGTFGLPIALGQLSKEHQLAVLEMGSDHTGEIAELARLAHPRCGVITAVTAAHLETLNSLDQVEEEKGALVRAIPSDGLVVLNYDDHRVRNMATYASSRVVFAGIQMGAAIQARDVTIGMDGMHFTLSLGKQTYPVMIPWFGRPRIFAALAAIAIGLEYGLQIKEMIDSLANLPWLAGRLNLLPALSGATLLDDTFNSSPAAVIAALDLLAELPATGRKIAILGDMYQLGSRTIVEHRRIGEYAASVVDELYVKGELATEIGRGAELAGLPSDKVIYSFSAGEIIRRLTPNHTDSLTNQTPKLSKGDLVLIKGSALTRLERVSRALLVDPEKDSEKLIRQHPVFDQIVFNLPGRPTWVEIDVEAIAQNTRLVKTLIGPAVKLMVVLKADGYGHGAVRIARVALNNGADCIAVASLNEAIDLRDSGISAPILILGFSPAWTARQAILNDVAVTLYDYDTARAFNRAAADLGQTAIAHLKVDTGMGRLGLLPMQVLPFLQQLSQLPNIKLEGIFSHFSVADSADPKHRNHTDVQLKRFNALLDTLEQNGLRPSLVHCANSAAILSRPDTHLNMVRLGIALYGLDPSPEVPCLKGFARALSFKTTVAQVKSLPKGTPISYGNTYSTTQDQKIAVIPVGYADGFRRAPAHWGHVLVRSTRAPIVGRVTMDQTMIDVTHIPDVRIGDQVVLIGKQGNEEITAEEVAENLGTINYEVVAGILARVPRIT